MKKLLKSVGRFFVRLWYLNRNQLLTQAFKILQKELAKRQIVLLSVPQDRRKELMQKDFVLKFTLDIKDAVDTCLEETGCAK